MFLIIITCIFIYKGLKFFVKLRHYFKDILNNYYNTIFTREKKYIKIYKKCSFKLMANLSKLNLIIILSFCKFIYFFNFINIHSL